MEVHDTNSHEPVFCFSTTPTKKARCLEAARKHCYPAVGDHVALFCRVANHQPACVGGESVCVSSAGGRQVLGPIFSHSSRAVCLTSPKFTGPTRLSDGVRHGYRRCAAWAWQRHTQRRTGQGDHVSWHRVRRFRQELTKAHVAQVYRLGVLDTRLFVDFHGALPQALSHRTGPF